MRATCLVLVMVLVGAAPARQTPDSAKVREAVRRADKAQAACLSRLEESAEYKSAVTTRDEKTRELAKARASGTQERRIEASKAYIAAKKRVDDMRAAALAEDDEVQAASKAVQVARREQTSADDHATEVARQEAARAAAEREFPVKPAKVGDLTVLVGKISVRRVPYADIVGRQKQTAAPYMWVPIGIRNTSDTKRVTYKSWASRGIGVDRAGSLTDELGNTYRHINFSLGERPIGGVEDESIYPGANVVDVLVFEPPVDKAKTFTLTLPGDNLGLAEPIVFEFSRDKVTWD